MINRDSTSSRGEVNTQLAHRDDPQSSKDAAANLNPRTTERVKNALLEVLGEQPSAPFEVQALYQLLRDVRDWPKVQPHSVNRRLSELKKAGRVRGTGVLVRTPDGATAERLEVVPQAEAAA